MQTPKKSNLFKTDQTAWVDSIHSKNMNQNQVRRMYDKKPKTIKVKGEKGESTHLMEYDPKSMRSYPSVVEIDGKLKHFETGDEAYNYADKTKEFIQFDNAEKARVYSSNGYKKGTGVLKLILNKEPKFKSIPKPNLAPQDATDKKNMYSAGSSSDLSGNVEVGFPNVKRNLKAVAGGLSLLRAIPTPPTQAIGWGASAVSAGMDVQEGYESAKKGNYGSAALSVGEAALDLIPLNKIAGYVKKPGIIVLNKALKQLSKVDRVKNFGTTVLKKAAVVNDVKDASAPITDNIKLYREGTRSISVLSSETRISPNLMKQPYNMKMKMKPKQKAARGLQDVAVPEAGNMGNVLSSGLSMGATGAELGGPWGAVAGGVAGIGLGLLQKGEQDKQNQLALAKNRDAKLNRGFDKVDNSIYQKGQTYAKGSIKIKASKMVEVEDKEHHFDSEMNHKGLYKGKTHKEGGINTVVEEGDSIIPAKHEAVVTKALKKGDIKTIKKIKATLPKDTPNGKAALGLNMDPTDDKRLDEAMYAKRDKSLRSPSLFGRTQYADKTNRKGAYNYDRDIVNGENGASTWFAQGEAGNPNAYGVNKVMSTGTMYRDDNMPKIKMRNSTVEEGVSALNTKIPTTLNTIAVDPMKTTGTTGGDASKDQSPIGNIGKYANLANNVIQGLKPEPTVDQSYLDPELLKYQDNSEGLRKQSRQAETVMGANARNTSGGMVDNIRANQQAAASGNLDRQESINEREVGRSDAIQVQNVGIKNNAKQVNLNRKDGYQDIMDRNRASSEAYMGAAAKEVADQSNINEQTNYLKSRDVKADALDQQKLSIINQESMYTIDANGNKVFNKNSSGGSMTNSGVTKSVTTKVDKDGKDSSSTTVKTAPAKATVFGRTSSRASVSRKTRKL